MRSIAFVAGMIFLGYSFHSCNVCTCKKISCPAFEDVDFQTWFAAYQSSQRSIFKYQSTFDTITTPAPHKNEAYEASQGCYGRSQGCAMDFSVGSNEITASFKRKLSIEYFGGPGSSSISLWVMGFDCNARDVNEQGLVLSSLGYSSNYAGSLILNGTTFNNVQVITRDTTMNHFTEQPYKVYLGKGTGLIAYEIFPSLQLWVKQ